MKMKLKGKLMLSFFLLISIPIIVLGIISYNQSSNSLQSTIEEQLKNETGLVAKNIDLTIDSLMNYIEIASSNETLKEAILNDGYLYREKAHNYLNTIQKDHSDIIENIAVTNDNGKVITINSGVTSDLDLSDRDYIKNALDGNEGISNVLISKETQNEVVAVSLPMKDKGKIIGTLFATMKYDVITNHVKDIKIGKGGYGFMVDKEGLITYHPDNNKVMKEKLTDLNSLSLNKIFKKMASGETGDGFYTFEGIKKYLSYHPVENWIVAVTANYDDYMSSAINIRNTTIIIAIISVIMAMIIAYITTTRNFIKPIKNLQASMEKAGKGDLTANVIINTKDEMESLGNSFNGMLEMQSKVIGQVKEFSQTLTASSQELAASSEEMSASSEEISASIEEVFNNADSQNNHTIDISKALVQLSSLVQLAKNKAIRSNENSTETFNTAEVGREKVKKTVESMNSISYSTNDTVTTLKDLDSIANETNSIVDVINSISEQTNLLALNASIEAARAGEHGKGFAVVADEIRKLSEETNNGANRISELLKEMITQVNKSVRTINSVKKLVDDGVVVANETDEAFIDIIEAVKGTVEGIKEIVNITEEEVATSDEIVNLINDVSTMAESTVDTSKEVATASEEQAAATENLAATAEENSSIAMSLDSLAQDFKIRGDNHGEKERG